MSQTAYTVEAELAFRGMLGDPNDDGFKIPLSNGAAAAQGFGIMVRRDATNLEDQFDILSAAGQAPVGVLVHNHAQENPALTGFLGVDLLEPASVLRRGRIWVRVEEAITVCDGVFFRHTTGTGTEIGAFRNDLDGAAEDITMTPTAVNDTEYNLGIHVGGNDYSLTFLSDASATATEINDGLRTAMALDAELTALVVATGTTTLILTAQVAGQNITAVQEGLGAMAFVNTTPPAPTCDEILTAQWLQGSTAAGVALLELNLP